MMAYFVKFKNLWKTKKAIELFMEDRDVELWALILKKYWSKCGKKQNKISWKHLADNIYSIYIRLSKSDSKGYCTCITSWDVVFRKDIQNWHYRWRAHLNTRFMDDNCFPQTYRDNVIYNWSYRDYHIKMVDIHWEEKERWLWEDNTIAVIKDWDYQDMIEKRHISICQLISEKRLEF